MEFKDVNYYCSNFISCTVQWTNTRDWEELLFENWEILFHWLAKHFYDIEIEKANICIKDIYKVVDNGKEC